jgi:tetratricopeptide (TPR) repeat protein
LAYLELLRGDADKAKQVLKPVIDFYSDKQYVKRVDESPNQPFWLMGLISTQKGDLKRLGDILSKMEQKIDDNRVNATNYFPIYKFYIHLKILEAYLKQDGNEALKYILEGKRIQHKMGYWSSMFDMACFFDEYAEILTKLKRGDEAIDLLKSVIEYNPAYVSSRLKLAKIYLKNNNFDEARRHYQKARELLSLSDEDYIFRKVARKIGKEINSQ